MTLVVDASTVVAALIHTGPTGVWSESALDVRAQPGDRAALWLPDAACLRGCLRCPRA